jgi:hypothetical protein
MPLQPSRRDVMGPPPRDVSDLASLVRHHASYLRQIDPGMLGGRFVTPRPVPNRPSQIVGDEGGDGDSETVIGEDGDRHTCFGAGQQLFQLSYTPIEETVHLYWHASDDSAGVKWERGEHWDIDDANGITIYAFTRNGERWPKAGHVFSAQYLRLDGDDDTQEVFLGSFVLDAAIPGEVDTGIIMEVGVDYRIVMSGNFNIDGPFPVIAEFPPAAPVHSGADSHLEPQADSVTVFRRAPSESSTYVGPWHADNPIWWRITPSEMWRKWAEIRGPEFTYSGGYPAGDPLGVSSDVIEGIGDELQFKFVDAPSGDNNGGILIEVYQV